MLALVLSAINFLSPKKFFYRIIFIRNLEMKFTDHSLVFTFQHLSVTLYVFCRGATIFNDPDHAGQTRGGTESDSRRTWKYVLTLQNKMGVKNI